MLRTLVILLISAAMLRAATDKVEVEAENIAAMDASLPVEYQAEALFRLLQSGKLSNRTVRDSMLVDLFTKAQTAIQPYPLIYVGPDANDTLEGRLPAALQAGPVSALAIQIEAVRSLAVDKPLESMDLFDQIRLAPVSSTCDAALLPDASIYYRELANLFDVVRKRYPAKNDATQLWLEGQLGKISSLVQFAPAAELISSIAVSNIDRQRLVAFLASRLVSLAPSSRDFSVETISHPLASKITRLIEQDQSLAPALVNAYAGVLRNLLQQPQCSDQKLRNAIDWFNGNLAPVVDSHSASVDSRGLASAKIEGTWQVSELDDLSRFHGLLRKLFALRDGPNGYVPDDNEPPANSEGWELDAGALLDGLRQWDEEKAACPACVFDRKAMMYVTLLDYLPAGHVADLAVAQYLDFMASSAVKAKNPAEWLEYFRMFLLLMREPSQQEKIKLANAKTSGKLLNMLPSPFASAALNKALASNDSYIRYMVTVEKFCPLPYAHPTLP